MENYTELIPQPYYDSIINYITLRILTRIVDYEPKNKVEISPRTVLRIY
ncbi:hypothetical protein [Acidianus bottle-shaped virus 3 strain ABV3]|uniref:Uncharacterized protein n=1 Tax=Acidianus bottle-shaped virus 3 strain ABV3 TaxID=1732174 RepID=A0A0N7FYX7_9VIRU|nr:hypothetical protein AVU00_gp50 [Acidianus bottle-shaped virus 3 strain ABV3]ALG96852.1 hypothetical protein [Acidianus bottle-shaped virus 3 strain ABV3]